MRVVRRTMAGLTAAIALGALTAGAAQASTEGPFYRITGARLGSSESAEVTVKAASSVTLNFTSLNTIVSCSTATASGAKAIGSAAGSSATGEETLALSKCTMQGNGGPSSCQAQEPITTEHLQGKLVYLGSERRGRLGYLLENTKTGHVFATLKFTGSGCNVKEGKLTGSVLGLVKSGGGEAVEVGKEPAEAKQVNLGLEDAPAHVWSEASGKLAEAETREFAGSLGPVAIGGGLTLELASGKNWGIFT